MTKKNVFKSLRKDDLIKYYSFDYRTMPPPKEFAKTQAIRGLSEDANEILDAIKNEYLNLTDGKKYLNAIIKIHNKLVYDIGGDNLLYLDEKLWWKEFPIGLSVTPFNKNITQ